MAHSGATRGCKAMNKSQAAAQASKAGSGQGRRNVMPMPPRWQAAPRPGTLWVQARRCYG